MTDCRYTRPTPFSVPTKNVSTATRSSGLSSCQVMAVDGIMLSVSPNTFTQGTSYQNVTISGSSFTSSSYHQLSIDGGSSWSWATSAPTFNGSTSLTVAVSNTTMRTVYLRVCASYGSSACSGSVSVAIQAAVLAPSISSISPNPITYDPANAYQTLTINGSNFVSKPSITLTWTGQPGYALPSSQVTFISCPSREKRLQLKTL